LYPLLLLRLTFINKGMYLFIFKVKHIFALLLI